jgi:signal transduction histidine kinase
MNKRQWGTTAFFITGGHVNREFLHTFQQLDLFRDLPEDDLNKFLAHCREETFDPQVVIFREGDLPDRFYVLLDGQVEIWKDYGTPYADVLALRGPGASFGEMSLIDELPRSATVRTAGSVRLVSLEKPHFRKVIEQNPAVALLIMRTVSHMVRVSNEAFQYGLRQKNLMLEKAYEDLKRAQDDLIRSERLSTLGKFASMIIHDLRNPLSIVKGYSEILAISTPDPERTTLLAGKLLSETERLNRMVGELLDYSRGSIRLNLGPIFPEQLFRNLREEFEAPLESRKIRLELENTVNEPLLLDAERIHRVFSNLVENGRKAMRQGGVLKISAHREGTCFEITVSDTGEGMDQETRARLFEPFFSASSSGGTGLGMLVVQNVVEAHQGTIEVDSELGCGTSVRIRLPLPLGSSS